MGLEGSGDDPERLESYDCVKWLRGGGVIREVGSSSGWIKRDCGASEQQIDDVRALLCAAIRALGWLIRGSCEGQPPRARKLHAAPVQPQADRSRGRPRRAAGEAEAFPAGASESEPARTGAFPAMRARAHPSPQRVRARAADADDGAGVEIYFHRREVRAARGPRTGPRPGGGCCPGCGGPRIRGSTLCKDSFSLSLSLSVSL